MELKHIIDNIKDVLSVELGERRVFDKDVAEALGLSRESLSHLKRRNSIPYEAIAYFCAKREISINWILFDQLPKSLQEKTEKFIYIKYFDKVHASAGGGAYNEDEEYSYILVPKEAISQYKADNLHATKVIGDSMEPTLQDGTTILCDVTCKQIQDGDIFMVHTQEGLLVKRVYADTNNNLTLISDNPQYTSTYITKSQLDDVSIIGKVIAEVKNSCR
jgi:phage repressor protein C with HTH and peptisase S24 domain